jgi:hypothetical protein
MRIELGMKVRAPEGYVNDFAGGEGIIEEVHVNGRDFRIRVTKKARDYEVGQLTNMADWDRDGNGGVPLEIVGDTPLVSDKKLGVWAVRV